MIMIRRGSLPDTPHTEFRFLAGVLALEEIHGSFGFSGPWTRKMHVRRYPTELMCTPRPAGFSFDCEPCALAQEQFVPYLFHTSDVGVTGNALTARLPLLFGKDTVFSLLKTAKSFPDQQFFRNGEHHELWFIQDGNGSLHSEFGELPFRKGHYVVVPKGTTYRIDLSAGSPSENSLWAIIIDSKFPIEWPRHYLNQAGQAHMTAPVTETQIGVPTLPAPRDETGSFSVFIKHHNGKVLETTQAHHPFDVCGWEGSLYPFTFDIHEHHGIARAIHTAPPAHQTFQSGQVPHNGFSLCSFVPQMEGWHPKDIPVPYAHLNVDSDEVMFFSNASYEARGDVIREGSITFHPGGIPHSPHGEAAERSLPSRATMSSRLAVMFDTYFENLQPTSAAVALADSTYVESWFKARAT